MATDYLAILQSTKLANGFKISPISIILMKSLTKFDEILLLETLLLFAKLILSIQKKVKMLKSSTIMITGAKFTYITEVQNAHNINAYLNGVLWDGL
jgi:hypothetical protein